jgi:hypothetical protein
MNKYPKYNMNPDGIIQWAIHSSINADNTFLDDMLEQLRTIDMLITAYDILYIHMRYPIIRTILPRLVI